jgi:serine/threonine-protein kinase
LLRERGRLPAAELRRLISDVATGLRDVHDAGVLHRDVKPENVMLTEADGRPRWKLVDFGVAKLMIAGVTENLLVGTPAYMAPEQLAGGSLDARTDLYSFCLVVYRALTGRPAFAEGDRAPNRRPPDPRRFLDLSMEMEMALRIGLAEEPGDRFASATELREIFLAALDERLSDAWHERGIVLLAAHPWSVTADPSRRRV